MAEAAQHTPRPTLLGWFIRDASITVIAAGLLWGMAMWHAAAGSWLSALVCAPIAFILAYALCYIYHEWGHLLGALGSGGSMRTSPYKGILIGTFNIADHTTRQFLALSWGGVLGYLSVASIAVTLYFTQSLGLVGAAFAIGGLAFVVQSLSVDLPQIVKVSMGAEPQATNAAGASGQVILRRTWQSWTLLTLVLLAWNML